MENKVLRVRAIRVTYRLRADAGQREQIERVHAVHADFCPVARSIRDCVHVDTSLELVEG